MWCSAVGVIVTLTLGLLTAPLTAVAQPSTKMHRIGILWLGAQANETFFEILQQDLRDLGYVEGQNLAFEHRYAPPNVDQLNALAAELVGLNVDVILAPGTPRHRRPSVQPPGFPSCSGPWPIRWRLSWLRA